MGKTAEKRGKNPGGFWGEEKFSARRLSGKGIIVMLPCLLSAGAFYALIFLSS